MNLSNKTSSTSSEHSTMSTTISTAGLASSSNMENPLMRLVDAAVLMDTARPMETEEKAVTTATTLATSAAVTTTGSAGAPAIGVATPSSTPISTVPVTRNDEVHSELSEDEEDRTSSCSQSQGTKLSHCEEVAKKPVTEIEVVTEVNKNKVTIGRREDLFDSEKRMSFAEQLYDVLEDESNHDVIAWMPDGDAFTILNHRKFALDSMPKLFKIRNMSSFVRKLTRWGFHRVHEKETRNSDIFRHELFRRGARNLLRKIRCVTRFAPRPEPSPGPARRKATAASHGGGPRFDYGDNASMAGVVSLESQTQRLPYQQQHPQGRSYPPGLAVSRSASLDDAEASALTRTAAAARYLARQQSLESQVRYQQSRAANAAATAAALERSLHHHRVTSQVVSAALDTLRREEASPSYRSLGPRTSSLVHELQHYTSQPATMRRSSTGTISAAAAAAAVAAAAVGAGHRHIRL